MKVIRKALLGLVAMGAISITGVAVSTASADMDPAVYCQIKFDSGLGYYCTLDECETGHCCGCG